MQRRTFLQASAGALALPAFAAGCQSTRSASPEQAALGNNRLDKFGLQLSTVTTAMLTDFEGTLAQVAAIGYRQVEFSALGFLGRSPERVQSLLTEHNLEAPVGRLTPKLPEGFFAWPREEAMKIYRQKGQPANLLENVRHSLDAALALEQRYLILPALMPDQFQSLDQVKRNIERLNAAGELCAAQGVRFGYHNHSWELATIDGIVPYELMLEQTPADRVTYQLDAYWIRKGGGDLSDYLSRHAGRFSTCHMKDIDAAGDFADVGAGVIDFPRFTREAIAQGAQYFFVERDNPPAPLESAQRSFEYLQQMTF